MKTKRELRYLFDKTKRLTEGFRIIRKEVLIEFQPSLLIFRCIMRVSQKDFSKLVRGDRSYLIGLEKEKASISHTYAKKISNKIGKIFNEIDQRYYSFERFYSNYKKFMNMNCLTSERAREIRKLRKNYPNSKSFDYKNQWKRRQNTKELSNIVAMINGDGHLQIDYKNYRYLVSYYSKYMEEINYFKKMMEKIFGVNGLIYLDERNNRKRYKLMFSSKPLCLFLDFVGVVSGKKTKKEFFIPDWIYNGKESIKSEFLKGLFDTEGSVSYSKGRWRMVFSQNKEKNLIKNGYEYMEQIIKLLNQFGIRCSNVCSSNSSTLRKDGTRSIVFKFSFERKYFGLYSQNVGFNNPIKKKKLLNALS